MNTLARIREKVRHKDYYLSSHAEEEMWADRLDCEDIEHTILNGWIEKRLTSDPRGTRYRIEGPAKDKRMVHIICRFDAQAELLVITVYAL